MKPNPVPIDGFRIRLRAAHMQSLAEMRIAAGGHLTLEEFVSELLESAVADFRLRTQECKPLPPANDRTAFVVKPLDKRGRSRFRSRFTADDIEMIQELRAEGMRSPAIAKRYRVTPQTIRRYLAGDDE